MATLATQTGIFTIPWILTWITLHQVVIIGAENLDPVYFHFSENLPKNTSLIPLPKNFDKFGDVENDCCTLALFFEVKDLDMDGTGMDAPEIVEGAQAQTGTGQATFKFEHPHIRDTDKIFTMDVVMDQTLVKSRHILNFDNCSTIVYKTFNIFATTSITDEKDVKVILVNGKDKNIPCQVPIKFKPIVPESIPFSEANSKSEGVPPVPAPNNLLTLGLGIVAAVSTFVSIVAVIALVYVARLIPKINSNNTEMQSRNEKCVVGGDDSDEDEVKSPIRGINRNAVRGGNGNEKCGAGSDDSDDEEKCPVKGGDNVTTTGQLQKAKTCKIMLIITVIFCILLAIISGVVAIVTA